MDDGSRANKSGFYLHTEGFSHEDVYLLVGMLHYKFDLLCSVQKHGNNLMIYIKVKSMTNFKKLVLPYFVPSMLYKIL
jgi:LAGLIDADG DNA endonuclease family